MNYLRTYEEYQPNPAMDLNTAKLAGLISFKDYELDADIENKFKANGEEIYNSPIGQMVPLLLDFNSSGSKNFKKYWNIHKNSFKIETKWTYDISSDKIKEIFFDEKNGKLSFNQQSKDVFFEMLNINFKDLISGRIKKQGADYFYFDTQYNTYGRGNGEPGASFQNVGDKLPYLGPDIPMNKVTI